MTNALLIDRFMPDPRLREVDRVAVATDVERTYAAVRAVDLYRVDFVRWLFDLRLLPERVVARLRGRTVDRVSTSTIDDIARGGSGFRVLGETPGREVVVGAVGKFWKPAIEFASVTPADFAAFDRPGYGRVAWCLRVDPREGGGSWVTVDVRVDATDDESFAKFRRYWRLIGRFSHAIRRALLRALAQDLGAAEGDDDRALPGDDFLPLPNFQRTHSVVIEAPPEHVWPWLVQMGAGRAGWYSIDRFDNGGVRSADRIIPELQRIAVGDVIPALPNREGGFAVLRIDAPRALVVGDPSLLPGGVRPAGPPWRTTWAFVLEPIGPEATRLHARVRADYEPSLTMFLVRPVMSLVHEIMERRQLGNLASRVRTAEDG